MKRGLHTRGYTIVEVLIVLAVSSALLISVMVGIGIQQRRTEFSQSINDFQAQVNDVINTVSTGYAVNNADFKCDVIPPGSGPTLTAGTNERGKSQDCIILGRVMQLGVGANLADYNTYTVVGQRQDSALKEVTTLADAKPKAVASQNGGSDSFEKATLGGGVTVTRMYFTTDGTTRQSTVALGFLSSFGQYNGCTGLCSGTTNVQLYGLKNSPTLGSLASQVTDATSGIRWENLIPTTTPTTTKGNVVICLKSGGTDQYGVITVGSNNRQLTTSLEVLSTSVAEGGKCSPS